MKIFKNQKSIIFIVMVILISACEQQELKPEIESSRVVNSNSDELTSKNTQLAKGKIKFDFIYCNEFMGGEFIGIGTSMSNNISIQLKSDYDSVWSTKMENGEHMVDDLKVKYGFYLQDTLEYSIYYNNRFYHSDTLTEIGLFDYYFYFPSYPILDISSTEIDKVVLSKATDTLGRYVQRFAIRAMGKASDENIRYRGAVLLISNKENVAEENALFISSFITHPTPNVHAFEHSGIIDMEVNELRKLFGEDQTIYYSVIGASGNRDGEITSYNTISNKEILPKRIYPNLSDSYINGEFKLSE